MSNKDEQLNMSFGTACNRLRKMILFALLEKHGENICYRCGKTIESVNNLTIDHKKPWLNNDASLFWDLNNVAFSHTKCNLRVPNRKIGGEGTAWCWKCQSFLPIDNFDSKISRWNGLNDICKSCESKRGIVYRSRRKK